MYLVHDLGCWLLSFNLIYKMGSAPQQEMQTHMHTGARQFYQ